MDYEKVKQAADDQEARFNNELSEDGQVEVQEPDEEEQVLAPIGYAHRMLNPRSRPFFYNKILENGRFWRRPPHNHCERCAKYLKKSARLLELGPALLSQPGEPEHAAHAAVVERAGGAVKVWAEQRALSLELPELIKHCDWEKTARPALKLRENTMACFEALLQLDYGGLNDSANQKVSVWSATVMTKIASKNILTSFLTRLRHSQSQP